MTQIPDEYIDREQAYVKHTILKSYLQRLFLIIGRSEIPVINYVDCFSGPWKEGDENLGDTSIGISLEQIAACQRDLKTNFGSEVKFRALFIEKNPQSFSKLRSFLDSQPHTDIETECLEGDYTNLLEEISTWCGGHFTFFFVDPTGWKDVVGARTMRPLLKLSKAEFLINLMYDFINRIVTVPKHADDMLELFGEPISLTTELAHERQDILLSHYRDNLNKDYQGRTTFVAINRPGKDRVHYYLVYLSRDASGIRVFKEEAEKMENVQRIVKQEMKLRQQQMHSATDDLFGGRIDNPPLNESIDSNKYLAKKYLLSKLSAKPLRIDREVWADFLEESNLYPSDLQSAMKELAKEGTVKNLDADVKRRYKHPIKGEAYSARGERWTLI